jgi:hypothetical protein
MECADIHVLARIEWHFFGSLTYKGKVPPERVRSSMWSGFTYQAAHVCRSRPSRLTWCRREERGESFGRLHQHFLLRLEDRSFVNLGTCFALGAKWAQMGGGMAEIRLFDPRLAGVDYIGKNLGGGDTYEAKKFNEASARLTLSHRLQETLKREARTSIWIHPWIAATSKAVR